MNSDFGIMVAFVFLLVVICTGFFMWGVCIGEKSGQVDCINGETYYELIVEEDKTSHWEYIPRRERREK